MTSKKCPTCKKRKANPRSGYCDPCSSEYSKSYYQKNRKRLLALEAVRRKKNPEQQRLKSRNTSRLAKRMAIDAYGGKCQCCGEDKIEFLSIDHVFGKGRQHRLSVCSPGTQFYFWLRRQKYPKKEFRVLCCNCNQSLGLYGYCPHVSASSFPESVRAALEAAKARRLTNSKKITIDNITLAVVEWSDKSGNTAAKINQRLRLNWSPKDAVFGKAK